MLGDFLKDLRLIIYQSLSLRIISFIDKSITSH